MRSVSRFTVLIGMALVFSVPATAVVTAVTPLDTPLCDVLSVPAVVEELGNTPPFPVGEQIASAPLGSSPPFSPCPGGVDSPFVPNQRVSITNLNSVAFIDVWYVADPETNISNTDGTVNFFSAFHIDNVGSNQPLISESLIADNIFDVGETWVFVIQDFASNLLGATSPANFSTIDVGAFGSVPSTGSIIAVAAPEPGTGLLLIAGLVGLRGRRRARA